MRGLFSFVAVSAILPTLCCGWLCLLFLHVSCQSLIRGFVHRMCRFLICCFARLEAGVSHALSVLPGMAAGVVLLVIFWCPEAGVSVYLLPGAVTSDLAF